MNAPLQRREFLRRMGLVAAGVVAADQLDLLDRLGWTRKFFPSAEVRPRFVKYALGFRVSSETVQDTVTHQAAIARMAKLMKQDMDARMVGYATDFLTGDLKVKATFDRIPTNSDVLLMQGFRKSILNLA